MGAIIKQDFETEKKSRILLAPHGDPKRFISGMPVVIHIANVA